MSFPRYPAYKPSGVEWLGEVPEHWDLSKLGFEAWVRARLGWKGLKAEEYVDSGIAFLSTPNIKGQLIDFSDVSYITPARYDESPEIKLSAGDVLLAKDGSTLGISNVVRTLPEPATVNSSIAVITPSNRLNSIYLYHLLSGTGVQQLIQQKKGGMGVPHLFQSDLVKFAVPVPPSGEQRAIATFLDHETAKIDALISEQQRLIELLQEKRQAVISHAVTKGLNPDAPMKDSGVEWLGEVPEHWEVTKYKRFCELQRGYDLTSDEREEGPYPVVTSGGINGFHSEFTAKAPGVVTGRYGSTGTVFYVEEDYWPHNTSLYIKDFHGNNPRFSWYLLQAIDLKSLSAKSAVPGIDRNDVHEIFIAHPHLQEQIEITKYLDDYLHKQFLLTQEAEDSMRLLQERRSALISAAVAGQIDVRGLVPEADAA